MGLIFLNQEFVDEEAAKVSVFDRGFLFGDGVYATLQVLDGVPLFAREHIARLKRVLESLKIAPPEIKEEWLHTLILKNDARKGVHRMRILVTGGSNPSMRLAPREHGNLIITVKPHTLIPYAPLKLEVFPSSIAMPHSFFKSLAHLGRYYVMEYGLSRGFDDAVTVSPEGYLLEAAFANLVWMKDETFYTPDPTMPLHYGVTITMFLEMLRAKGYKTDYAKTTLQELPEGALLFRTNSMSWIRPVTQVGDRHFSRDLKTEEFLCHSFKQLAEIQASKTLVAS